ncbi:MAG: class I SAM-dependent methyltransferase [Magnetococcales bacterium]|nr:class I SAM-dependent methyltransferase [Magnetococcales bacterium]
MSEQTARRDQTIRDFSEKWDNFQTNEGYHASVEWSQEKLGPLINLRADLPGKRVAEIGSGSGRLIGQLCECGASFVLALEPSSGGFQALKENTKAWSDRITYLNERGDKLPADADLDIIFSIGVLHHIPDPRPVVDAAWRALRPGGRMIIWLYGYEGNRAYLCFTLPLRWLTVRMPHAWLTTLSGWLVKLTDVYTFFCRYLPLPLRHYFVETFSRFTPERRLVAIYDQLDPRHAKYYTKQEAMELLRASGFEDIQIYQYKGYSWSVCGGKPDTNSQS